MFRVVIEEREVMKMMGSDEMEFSGKRHFRSRDYAAFLTASHASIENKNIHDSLANKCYCISFLEPHPMHTRRAI